MLLNVCHCGALILLLLLWSPLSFSVSSPFLPFIFLSIYLSHSLLPLTLPSSSHSPSFSFPPTPHPPADCLPMPMKCKDSTSTPSESSEKRSMWSQEHSQRTLEATPLHLCTHCTPHTLPPALVSLLHLQFIFHFLPLLYLDWIWRTFSFLWNTIYYIADTPSFPYLHCPKFYLSHPPLPPPLETMGFDIEACEPRCSVKAGIFDLYATKVNALRLAVDAAITVLR